MVKGVITKIAACCFMVCFLAASTAFAGTATIATPANGSTIAAKPAAFTWNKAGQDYCWIYVGSTVGGYQYASAQIDNSTTTIYVPNLPTDNSTVYVQFWSKTGATWTSSSTSYKSGTTSDVVAVMTSPAASGTTIAGTSYTFEWSAAPGASRYYLMIGNTGIGSQNLYANNVGSATSAYVKNLPLSGTLNVRLYTYFGSLRTYRDYSYNASTSVMTTPATQYPTRLAKPAVFAWTDDGADKYWLYIGSSVGAYNYYSTDVGLNLTATVPGLPSDNSTVYVRLWTRHGSTWGFNDYTYKANGTGTSDKASITTPANTSDNLTASVNFVWDNATKVGADRFWLAVGSTGAGSYNIVNANMGTVNSKTVSGLPNHSNIYVRLFTFIGYFQAYKDYIFHTGY